MQFKSVQLSTEQTRYKEINKDGISKYQKINENNIKTNENFDEYLNFDDDDEDDEFNSDDSATALDNSFMFMNHKDISIDLKLSKTPIKIIEEIKNEKILINEKVKLNKSQIEIELELKNEKKIKINDKIEEKVFLHIDNINCSNLSNNNNNTNRIKKTKLKKNDNRKILKKSNNKKTSKNKQKCKLNDINGTNNNNISNQIFLSSSENYSPTSSISTSNNSFTSYDYNQTQQINNYHSQQHQQQQQHRQPHQQPQNYPSTIYSPVNNMYATVPEFFDRFHDYQFPSSITPTTQYYNQPSYSNKLFQNSNNYGLNYTTKTSSSSSPLTVSPLSIDSTIKVTSPIIKTNQKDLSNIYSQKSMIKDVEIKTPVQSNNVSYVSTSTNLSTSTASVSTNVENNENNKEIVEVNDADKISDKNNDNHKKTNGWNICETSQPKLSNFKNDIHTNIPKLKPYENCTNIMEDSNTNLLQTSINHYHHYQQQLNYNLHFYKTGLSNLNYSSSSNLQDPTQINPNHNQVSYSYLSNKQEISQHFDENELYNKNCQLISNRLHLQNFNETKNFGYYNNTSNSNNNELTNDSVNNNNNNNNVNSMNEDLSIPACYDYSRQNVVSQGFVMTN
jgi:hypothetical protein